MMKSKLFTNLLLVGAASALLSTTAFAGTWARSYEGGPLQYYDDNGYTTTLCITKEGWYTVNRQGVWDGGRINCYSSLTADNALSYISLLGKCADVEEYCLFDMTGDGAPEIFIKEGTCEADYMWHVFSWNGSDSVSLGEFGGGHSMLLADRVGNIYVECAHMGDYMLNIVGIQNGAVETTTVFEGQSTEYVDYEDFDEQLGVYSLPYFNANGKYEAVDYSPFYK